MHQGALFLALLLCVGRAAAGCWVNEQGAHQCTGISWTSRMWIIVGAAVVFVICNIIAVHYIRKYYKRRKQRLPGAKGARRYEVGEYWQQRQEYLPNYTPPKPLLPVASSTSSMQPLMAQTASRPSQSSIRTPMSRASSRSAFEHPPVYTPVTLPLPSRLRHANSDTTLAEVYTATPAPPTVSIARTGPPISALSRSP